MVSHSRVGLLTSHDHLRYSGAVPRQLWDLPGVLVGTHWCCKGPLYHPHPVSGTWLLDRCGNTLQAIVCSRPALRPLVQMAFGNPKRWFVQLLPKGIMPKAEYQRHNAKGRIARDLMQGAPYKGPCEVNITRGTGDGGKRRPSDDSCWRCKGQNTKRPGTKGTIQRASCKAYITGGAVEGGKRPSRDGSCRRCRQTGPMQRDKHQGTWYKGFLTRAHITRGAGEDWHAVLT